MKEKVSVRGAPAFMKFYNTLDKKSKEHKEIDEALDLLKEDCSSGDKISL